MRMLNAIPALPVKDIDKSAIFYRDKLGFTINHVEKGFAIILCHEVEIHLWLADDEGWKNGMQSNACPVTSGAESFISGTASCRIQVVEIDKLYNFFKPLGVCHKNTLLGDRPWGSREFDALDLDGNLITFFQRIQ